MELFRAVDWGAYNFFQFQTRRNPWLESALLGGDYLGNVWGISAIVAVTVILLVVSRQTKLVFSVLSFTALALVLVMCSQRIAERERPPDATNRLGRDVQADSFPSGQVLMASLNLSLFGLCFAPRLQTRWSRVLLHIVLTILILYVCMSQLVLKLHFVSDVIGGLLGGLGLALISRSFVRIRQETT